MPMTLSGDGTITGLAAGGLPNGTVQPSDLSTGAPTWDTSGNANFTGQIRGSSTGVPPLLADSAGNTATCRAWGRFILSGTTLTTGASFNVSSITRSATGSYDVVFALALADANYSVQATPETTNDYTLNVSTPTATGFNLRAKTGSNSAFDMSGFFTVYR